MRMSSIQGEGLDAPAPLELVAKRLFLHPLVNYIIPSGVLRVVMRASSLGAESMARPRRPFKAWTSTTAREVIGDG